MILKKTKNKMIRKIYINGTSFTKLIDQKLVKRIDYDSRKKTNNDEFKNLKKTFK